MKSSSSIASEVPWKVDMSYVDRKRSSPETKNPDKKGEEYCQDRTIEIYSCHLRNKTGLLYSEQVNFPFLRLYGNGDQPREKYIEYFYKEYSSDDKKKNEDTDTPTRYDVDAPGGWSSMPRARRKGFMHVLFDIISYAPKIKANLIRKFENAEFDIVADPVDAYSGAEMENKKYELWAIKENLGFLNNYYRRMGVKYGEPDYVPETLQELDLFKQRGGFKPLYAQKQEILIKHTCNIARWKEIKKRMIADAIDIGYFGCKDCWDDELSMVKPRYIDPEYLVIQHSDESDFSDSEYAGHFQDFTVSELKLKGFEDDELMTMAKSYSGYQGNPLAENWDNYKGSNNYGGHDFDFYKICVFVCEWVDIDEYKEILRDNRFGKKRIIPMDYDKEVKENDKTKVRTTEYRTKYGYKWIVGTEYGFDHGRIYDITRPTKKEVNLSYHIYKLSTKSITEQLYPIYDNFMILWIKYQNAIAMAINQGYAIDYDSIASMKLGGEKNNEEMIIRRFLQTGILIFKRTKQVGQPGLSANTPVQELKGGLGNVFTQFREGFNFNVQLVENLTGFSPLTIGGTPDKDAPVKTSEMSYAATNDILGFILSGYLRVKEMMAKNVSLWIQVKIKQGGGAEEAYREIIGDDGIKIMKLAEKNNVQYGINLIPRPTEIEKREIYESAKISLQNGRDGKPGITEADFFSIMNVLNSGGSLKLAEMILENSIGKSQKRAERIAKENIKLQEQSNLKLKEADTKKVIVVETTKKDLELRNKEKEHEWKMEEMDKEQDHEIELAKINKENKVENTVAKT